jgi:hypothetical protein
MSWIGHIHLRLFAVGPVEWQRCADRRGERVTALHPPLYITVTGSIRIRSHPLAKELILLIVTWFMYETYVLGCCLIAGSGTLRGIGRGVPFTVDRGTTHRLKRGDT